MWYREDITVSSKKMKILVVLVVICSLTSFDAKSFKITQIKEDKNLILCITKHLKNTGRIENDDFSEENFNPEQSCDTVINRYSEKIYANLRQQLLNDPDFKNDTNCMMEKLKKTIITEFVMKESLYRTATQLAKNKRNRKISKSRKSQIILKNEAACECATTRERKDMFEQRNEEFEYLMNDNSITEEDPELDYCVRKHVIDHKFLDTQTYNVSMNPTHIDVSDINCDAIIKLIIEDDKTDTEEHYEAQEEEHTPEEIECMVEKHSEYHYVEKLMTIKVLKELKMTEEQKNAERQKYVEMLELIKKAMNKDC